MGCLENDCFFGNFAIHNLCKMDYADLQLYAKLLEENDATLLSWITQQRAVPENFSQLFAKILSYNINKP
jgi:succinate dehydrogenase flavin-adding protein (antitoxin of CptAB toxin-antitoxin module)